MTRKHRTAKTRAARTRAKKARQSQSCPPVSGPPPIERLRSVPLSTRSPLPPLPDPTIQRRDLTVRSFALRSVPETLDEDTRSVEAVIATEDPILVWDMRRWEPIREILLMDGVQLPANGQIPLLDTHQRHTVYTQLGSMRNIRVAEAKLLARGYYSTADMGEDAWIKVREGHITDHSVGFRIISYVEIAAGATEEINGREFTAPPDSILRVVTASQLRECSVCALGADAGAKLRTEPQPATTPELAARAPHSAQEASAMTFEAFVRSLGLDPENLKDEQRTALQAAYDSRQSPAPAAPPAPPPAQPAAPPAAPARTEPPAPPAQDAAALEAARAEGARLEHERVAAIRAAALPSIPQELVEEQIADTARTVDQARAAFLDHLRGARPEVANGAPAVYSHGGETPRNLLAPAMLLRSGHPEAQLVERFGANVMEQAHGLRGLPMLEVASLAIRAAGLEVPANPMERARVAFSTVTLPAILADVVQASLARGYSSKEETWRKWCSIGSAPNFNTIRRTRLTLHGAFEDITPAGEIPGATVEDEHEDYALGTKGRMIVFTRQDMINDNLGALTRIPFSLGVQGALAIAKAAYTALMANAAMDDSVALFHADHSNLLTGSALTATTFGTALALFRNQTDKAGDPIDVQPKILLVPTTLEGTAKGIINSKLIVVTGTTDAEKPDGNVWEGAAEVVTDPRLENANYTNYAATTWYLIGDPSVVDTVEVSFLNGVQTPVVEPAALPSTVLGTGWRAYLDMAAKAIDTRTMVRATA